MFIIIQEPSDSNSNKKYSPFSKNGYTRHLNKNNSNLSATLQLKWRGSWAVQAVLVARWKAGFPPKEENLHTNSETNTEFTPMYEFHSGNAGHDEMSKLHHLNMRSRDIVRYSWSSWCKINHFQVNPRNSRSGQQTLTLTGPWLCPR